MPLDDRAFISEHILEIRYRALGRIIDLRGFIADHISAHTDFSYWSMTDSRVDFRLKEDATSEMAFVSHKNLGYTVRRPETRNYFPERAARFVRELLRVEGLELRPVVRFGVRARVLIPSRRDFAGLNALVNQVMPLHKNHTEPFNAEIEDVGPVVILKRGDSKLRVQSGPMPIEQARVLLEGQEGLPDAGFFIDVDQYRSDVGSMDQRDVTAQLGLFHERAWQAIDFYNRLLD